MRISKIIFALLHLAYHNRHYRHYCNHQYQSDPDHSVVHLLVVTSTAYAGTTPTPSITLTNMPIWKLITCSSHCIIACSLSISKVGLVPKTAVALTLTVICALLDLAKVAISYVRVVNRANNWVCLHQIEF